MKNIIRKWTEGEYQLTLFNERRTDQIGRYKLSYKFYHKGKLIFKGDDYSPAPSYELDSDRCVGGLLSFLSLKPGDTDEEYFEDYTKEQLEWAIENGEDLSCYAIELEEGPEN